MPAPRNPREVIGILQVEFFFLKKSSNNSLINNRKQASFRYAQLQGVDNVAGTGNCYFLGKEIPDSPGPMSARKKGIF